MLEENPSGRNHRRVPGVPRQELTKEGRRKLAAANARIERGEPDLAAARKAWAGLVRELGQAAMAREMGATPQAIAERLKTIERGSHR